MKRKKRHDKQRHQWRMQYDLPYRLKKILNAIYHRCRIGSGQPYYEGLTVALTLGDLLYLWVRDQAWMQVQPSIDRINNKQGYLLDNCRFIPFRDNIRRAVAGRDEQKKVASLRRTLAEKRVA